MAMAATRTKMEVPTKNTFVHFVETEEHSLARTLSCPAIITKLDQHRVTKALFRVEDDCSSVSTEGCDESSQGSPSETSLQDGAESSGTWTRSNSPVNLGINDAIFSGSASRGSSPCDPEHSQRLPRSTPPNLGVVGIMVPIMPQMVTADTALVSTMPASQPSVQPATTQQPGLQPGLQPGWQPSLQPVQLPSSQPAMPATQMQCGLAQSMPGFSPDLVTQPQSVESATAANNLAVGAARAPKKPSTSIGLQKRINKELVVAGQRNRLEVLKVASKHLGQMNGVNLATAFHRLAKSCGDEAETLVACSTFQSMLHVAEHYAEQELVHRDGSMPSNCCTIVAWSCAQLKVFQVPLFAKLMVVATPQLRNCQPYEVTNLLWAVAEFYKYEQDTAAALSSELRGLVDAVANVFSVRQQGDFKVQVLTSALMSVSALPWDQSFAQTWLFNSTFEELGSRWEELADQGQAHVSVALERLRMKCLPFFQNVVRGGNEKFPSVMELLEALAPCR